MHHDDFFVSLFSLQQAIEKSNTPFNSGAIALRAPTNWAFMRLIYKEHRSKLFTSLPGQTRPLKKRVITPANFNEEKRR